MFLVGSYLGREAARTFNRRETGETVNVRPRIGIQAGDDELEVAVRDDLQLEQITRGWTKGQRVRVPVEVRPPFGARGAVTYALPGVIESTRRRWS